VRVDPALAAKTTPRRIRDKVLHEERVVNVLREVRRRLVERTKVIDTETHAVAGGSVA
jgi:hypothetical protein